MENKKISVIVPVYNEEKLIEKCLDALISLSYPKRDYEIIVVNDGSTDNTFEIVRRKQKECYEKEIDIKIVNLEKNKGRLMAREIGAMGARYDNLLFIDSRCVCERHLLRKIEEINYQPIIGNVIIDTKRSVFDRFNWLTRKKLYLSQLENDFKSIYITKDNFDKVAKGTGIFFCDKKLFLSSQPINKNKNVSDDIKLLWNIVQKKDILRHQNPKVLYLSRTSFKKEMGHTLQRGPKFVDYYLNPKKKYFWLFIFLPFFALIFTIFLILTNLTYFLYWIGFLILIWIITSIWLAENIKDFFIVFGLLPIIGFSFELGILRGLIFKLLRKY